MGPTRWHGFNVAHSTGCQFKLPKQRRETRERERVEEKERRGKGKREEVEENRKRNKGREERRG